jgi:hypothetical protein
MTEDADISPEERDAYRMRFGEYRHIPVARCGPFRVDRVWFRRDTTEERESLPELVFEIDASSEFDMLGAWLPLYRAGMRPESQGYILSPQEIVRLATAWVNKYRHSTGTSIARYRRRVGPAAEGAEVAPGEWLIMPIFRPAGRLMISMVEAIPLVEAALASLER